MKFQTHIFFKHLVQANLKLLFLLPPPPKCWDCMLVTPPSVLCFIGVTQVSMHVR